MTKKATITEVARAAGVSIATVSRVLNKTGMVADELREKVEQAVIETGYQSNPIAASMKNMKRNQIAIIIPTLRRNYYTDIIKGISDECYRSGFVPAILESNGDFEKEKQLIQTLEAQWVDGIVLVPGVCSNPEEYTRYAQYLAGLKKRNIRIPVVLVDSPEMDCLDSVSADYESSFFQMTEHLLEIGRTKLAFLGNARNVPMYGPFAAGVQKAMAEHGMTVDPHLVKNGNFTVLHGYHAVKELLAENTRFDGLVCVNDQVAAGAQNACQECGLVVPNDVAIIGFGGVALSIVPTPSISTMTVPRLSMGQIAARMLLERINGKRTETLHERVKGYLAIRGSTMRSARKDLDVMFTE